MMALQDTCTTYELDIVSMNATPQTCDGKHDGTRFLANYVHFAYHKNHNTKLYMHVYKKE
jgi:hypothetical protein